MQSENIIVLVLHPLFDDKILSHWQTLIRFNTIH